MIKIDDQNDHSKFFVGTRDPVIVMFPWSKRKGLPKSHTAMHGLRHSFSHVIPMTGSLDDQNERYGL